ncbi:MAG: hypothetical protein ACHREM_04780 [Polyangiales bacterium]
MSDEIPPRALGIVYVKPMTLIFGIDDKEEHGVRIHSLDAMRLKVKAPARFASRCLRFDNGVLDHLSIEALIINGKRQRIFMPDGRVALARFLHDAPISVDKAQPGSDIELLVCNRTGGSMWLIIALHGFLLDPPIESEATVAAAEAPQFEAVKPDVVTSAAVTHADEIAKKRCRDDLSTWLLQVVNMPSRRDNSRRLYLMPARHPKTDAPVTSGQHAKFDVPPGDVDVCNLADRILAAALGFGPPNDSGWGRMIYLEIMPDVKNMRMHYAFDLRM